jgi:sporulation-control protein
MHRDADKLELWFEIDRQSRGIRGMMASLLGMGELKRSLVLPAHISPQEAAQRVIDFLEASS